jgi:cephalosporin hydroxylase
MISIPAEFLQGGGEVQAWERFRSSSSAQEWFDFASGIFPAHQQQQEILDFLSLAKSQNPRVVMEIGTARSGTNFLLAQVLDSVQMIIALDLRVRNLRLLNMFSRPSLNRVCIEGSSYNSPTFDRVNQVLGGKKLDVLFIDGDHSYEGVLADYKLYAPLVRPGGLIAFNDIVDDHYTKFGRPGLRWAGGVPRLWRELKDSRQDGHYWEFIRDPDQDGMGIGVLQV